MRKDTALKVIMFSVFGLVFLWLAKAILFPTNYYGFGISMNGIFGGEHMYMNGNYGFGAGTFSVLLVFVIKVLIVLFVIALIAGLLMAAKNYIFNSKDFSTFKSGFVPTSKPKKTCNTCGKSLDDEWKVCPYCASEVKEK